MFPSDISACADRLNLVSITSFLSQEAPWGGLIESSSRFFAFGSGSNSLGIIPLRESGMTWADKEVAKAEKQKYGLRDAAKVSDPEFAELAGRVLINLEQGLVKLGCSWRIMSEPGLYMNADQNLHRSNNGKYFRVSVDYSNRSFIVESRSHPNWRNFTRTVTPSFVGGMINGHQVDEIATQVVGTFLPHFTSPTFILKEGLTKEQEAELDKQGVYDTPSAQSRYDPKTGAILGGPKNAQNGGFLSRLFGRG